MNKSTILVFVLSVMIFSSIGAVAIIMIPDSSPESYTVKKYEAIDRQEYNFVDTKSISLESIEQVYDVNQEILNKLIKEQNYKPGTNNPFANIISNNTNGENSGGTTGNTGGTTGGNTSGETSSGK